MNYELLKVSKMVSLKIYVSSHGEARNIKFGHQVNLIQRVQLGPLSQEIVTSLPHHHVTLTNLLSAVTEGLLLSNLGCKNNSLTEVHRVLLHWGSNVITF